MCCWFERDDNYVVSFSHLKLVLCLWSLVSRVCGVSEVGCVFGGAL